ncbi:hypothetical protein FGO68_gene14409 [Halteria grandinella]|uniref:Uncharacterized protein n=1 Tax=Halteria grandinella TaxID=5974 RepID=A0A8J8NW21_HALGN|nr:hypothetical protein FGO68_gene14409 [Halteria grandinella]
MTRSSIAEQSIPIFLVINEKHHQTKFHQGHKFLLGSCFIEQLNALISTLTSGKTKQFTSFLAYSLNSKFQVQANFDQSVPNQQIKSQLAKLNSSDSLHINAVIETPENYPSKLRREASPTLSYIIQHQQKQAQSEHSLNQVRTRSSQNAKLINEQVSPIQTIFSVTRTDQQHQGLEEEQKIDTRQRPSTYLMAQSRDCSNFQSRQSRATSNMSTAKRNRLKGKTQYRDVDLEIFSKHLSNDKIIQDPIALLNDLNQTCPRGKELFTWYKQNEQVYKIKCNKCVNFFLRIIQIRPNQFQYSTSSSRVHAIDKHMHEELNPDQPELMESELIQPSQVQTMNNHSILITQRKAMEELKCTSCEQPITNQKMKGLCNNCFKFNQSYGNKPNECRRKGKEESKYASPFNKKSPDQTRALAERLRLDRLLTEN